MINSISYKKCLEKATQELRDSKILNYEFDALELLLFAKKIDKSKYIIIKDTVASNDFIESYFDLINKRKKHIPLQHLIGHAWFYARKYKVNKNVLVPRFETEVLCENAIKIIKSKKLSKVLDLCTGSGCIGITLDLECEGIKVKASDISNDALEIARDNNKKNKGKVEFVLSDLFDNINEKFDIIVSNPPYISVNELEELDEEVKNFDPKIALTDFDNGLTFYKEIAINAKNYLNSNGYLVFEIGSNQAKDVKEILEENKYCNIEIYKDLTVRDRVVVAQNN